MSLSLDVIHVFFFPLVLKDASRAAKFAKRRCSFCEDVWLNPSYRFSFCLFDLLICKLLLTAQ